VTNSSDRTIRQFNLPTYPAPSSEGLYLEQELEPTHRFNDPINRTAWHAVAYSPDGEWLAGGAADPANHKIYIWDISNDGQFAATLDGGREPLTYIHVCGNFQGRNKVTRIDVVRTVASIEERNSINNQSGNDPNLALSYPREMGRVRRWI
jgi:WD40 repeat protein